MTTTAEIPLSFELPHVLIMVWLGAGCFALWVAQKLRLPRHQSVNILLPMALGLMVFTLFIGTRYNYDFLIDDIDIVQTNPDVVNADGWKTLWKHDYWTGRSTDANLYRPVTILSYWVNARLPLCGRIVEGRAVEVFPRYFRGVNIVLLTGLAWLIALWLSHYVQQTAAWAVAFLFSGHSVHAEMVNYVVCRADLLCMLGVVGFLYMQRIAIEARRWRWWSAALAVFSALVAVGSKESGVILLPAALAQAWVGARHANTEVTDDLEPTPRAVTLGWIASLFAPFVLFLLCRFTVIGAGVDYTDEFGLANDIRDNPLRFVSTADRIPAAISIAWFYFKQVFSPDTRYYHLPAELPGWTSGETIRGITVIVVLCILLAAYLRRHRWQAVAIVLALGQFLIVGNLWKPVGVYAANRLILPFTLAAAILGAAFIHWFCGHSHRRRAVTILPTFAAICLMAYETQEVNQSWRSELRLMGRDYQLAPNHPVTLYNFGTVRAREAMALDSYVRALNLAVEFTDQLESAMNLPGGSAEVFMRSTKPALDSIRRALAVKLETAHHLEQTQALRDILALYDRTGVQRAGVLTTGDVQASSTKLAEELDRCHMQSTEYWDSAQRMLEQVIVARPASISARLELARVLELVGKKVEAREQYRALVNLAKNDLNLQVVEARIRYAKLCIDLSRDKDGAEKSLAIAEVVLASILQQSEKLTAGQVEDLHVLNRNAKRYLGMIAWKDHRIRTAIRRHSELLKIYPDFAEAKADLQQWIEQQSPHDANPND
jgi:tetratricopeptide (TPR) repeat protein